MLPSQSIGFILFISLLSFAIPCIGDVPLSDLQKLDALIQNPGLYDPRIPSLDENQMANVGVELRIRNIWNIDQKSMDLKMNVLLSFHWKDFRLANISDKTISITSTLSTEQIWVPEMFFSNSKTGKFHKVAIPNQIMHIYSNGNVTLVRRYYVHFTCAMDFRDYPFDKQTCSLEISYIRKTHGVFAWINDHAVSVHRDVRLPEFDVYKMEPTECETSGENVYSLDANIACLKAIIHFRRRMGFYIVNVYVPSVMIVMVSWTSFWMDINAAPGRISLSVTTLLTISTKASSLQSMTAEVSYVKAVDIWMGVCTGFVFFSLIEFVFANYIWRMNNAKSKKETNKDLAQLEAENNLLVEIPRWRRANMDRISRILFPSVFALFSLVYWIYYLI